jgi:hypothetical protein
MERFTGPGRWLRRYRAFDRAEADLGRDLDWRRVDERPRPTGGAP